VKPTEGSGSVGVKLCCNPEEAAAQMRLLLEKKYNERGLPLPQEVLIEHYLDGPEYSVEVFGLQAVGVTRKHLSVEPYFVEVGHDFPATLTSQARCAIQEAATRALSAVGLSWGPAHVELRLTSAGPVVVEINPRLAGGFIPELVRLSTGIDLIEATVSAAISQVSDVHATSSKHASIRFLMPRATGVLGEIRGFEEAASLEGVADLALYRKAGDPLTAHGDFRDRLGHVISCHDSAERAIQVAQQALGMLVAENV
jgi:biotin carboxylase